MKNFETDEDIYIYVRNNKDNIDDISIYEDLVIEKDPYGCWCHIFARNIKGVNIKKLNNAAVEKGLHIIF
jgi:hypothetical protein